MINTKPDAFQYVLALYITTMAAFATLFAISQWNTRLHSWTYMDVFTLRAMGVLLVAFAWTVTAFIWRDILKRSRNEDSP